MFPIPGRVYYLWLQAMESWAGRGNEAGIWVVSCPALVRGRGLGTRLVFGRRASVTHAQTEKHRACPRLMSPFFGGCVGLEKQRDTATN